MTLFELEQGYQVRRSEPEPIELSIVVCIAFDPSEAGKAVDGVFNYVVLNPLGDITDEATSELSWPPYAGPKLIEPETYVFHFEVELRPDAGQHTVACWLNDPAEAFRIPCYVSVLDL